MDDDDFKILPDKDDLRAMERQKRHEEIEQAYRKREALVKLNELKESLMAGLDMSLAAIFMAKSCIALDIEALKDKEFLKLLNQLNDLTEKLVREMTT